VRNFSSTSERIISLPNKKPFF